VVGAWNPGPADPVTGAAGAGAAAGAVREGATDGPAGRGVVTGAAAAGRAGAAVGWADAEAAAAEGADAAGADTDGAVVVAGLAAAGAETCGVATAGADAAGRAAGAGPGEDTDGRGAADPGRPGPPEGALLGAADPLVGRSAFGPAGFVAGNASRSLRTTGASMVEDGDLTNSPMSVSFAMISLLVLPSSFASSCTRALPATALLRDEGWRPVGTAR